MAKTKADPDRAIVNAGCAIYTRKSSDEGLDQEFNSLDAQREACSAFIRSQKHAGWRELPARYDDGGISGGTMERPALKRLLADIAAGRVQIVVVYKVDRLTRSLADFAKIVDVLDTHGASFVSVTQQFNTTTSMGRLTLNMLLSFAQFEREIAGERIRDKIAASKAKGMWMGGSVPLGYDVVDRKLIVNRAEAETVRLIFRSYRKLGMIALLKEELDRTGIVSKRRRDKSGRCCGGKPFSRGALYTLLKNRVYRGEIVHRGMNYQGQHKAIVEGPLWDAVQERLTVSRTSRSSGTNTKAPSLLTGLLVDSAGHRMTPTHAVKSGRRYRYYVSRTPMTGSKMPPHGQRLPAGDVDALVLDRLRQLFRDEDQISQALSPFELDAGSLKEAMVSATTISSRWPDLQPNDIRDLARSIIKHVALEHAGLTIDLNRSKILSALMPEAKVAVIAPLTPAQMRFSIAAEARLRRSGKGLRFVVAGAVAGRPDQSLIRLMARAVKTRDTLLSGSDDSLEAMTRRLKVTRGYLNSLVRISYLAPDIVGAILDGRQPVELTAKQLLRAVRTIPVLWIKQGQVLGFALTSLSQPRNGWKIEQPKSSATMERCARRPAAAV